MEVYEFPRHDGVYQVLCFFLNFALRYNPLKESFEGIGENWWTDKIVELFEKNMNNSVLTLRITFINSSKILNILTIIVELISSYFFFAHKYITVSWYKEESLGTNIDCVITFSEFDC